MKRYGQARRRDNLAAWLALALAAALAAAGLALASPARADDVEQYLDALHERGIYAGSGDGTLVQAGMQVCDLIEAGMSPLAVAAKVYRETDASISAEDAGYIVGVAIGGLCPEYAYLVKGQLV